MQSSIIKYALALATAVALSQSQAEMVQSSSFNHDNDNSRLAARVLNKEAQSFNSNFTNLSEKLSLLISFNIKKTSEKYFVFSIVNSI